MTQESDVAREIVSSRDFSATPEVLFQAFSDPGQVAQWWGPNGFTNTMHEFDLRPGGRWRLTMHGPDGTDYDNASRFIEVVRGERIVFQHEEPVHGFRMTMTFMPRDSGSRLTWHMCFDSAEEVARIGSIVAAANEQNFDRLAFHLSKSTRKPSRP